MERVAMKIVLAIVGVGCIIVGYLLKKKGNVLIGIGLTCFAGSAIA